MATGKGDTNLPAVARDTNFGKTYLGLIVAAFCLAAHIKFISKDTRKVVCARVR
jgi:hypothetical protein